ncbi:uncharacterized protein LOC129589970 [Paramacrobiotus metropolitanus]|uniref:uncharacterized protein LOC129589970 n=1 Tax=Paramacrobiotus metropolitanus TaxID=2943436 RepID=UPI002445DACD|nr:uncharacterized protein LOC129589970 [Paramacrobiotus metropolitanus]
MDTTVYVLLFISVAAVPALSWYVPPFGARMDAVYAFQTPDNGAPAKPPAPAIPPPAKPVTGKTHSEKTKDNVKSAQNAGDLPIAFDAGATTVAAAGATTNASKSLAVSVQVPSLTTLYGGFFTGFLMLEGYIRFEL